MNAAIGICVLVLGGVLIPGVDSSVDQQGSPARQEAIVEFEVPGPGPSYPAPGPSYPGRRAISPGSGQAAGPSLTPSFPAAPYAESPQVNRQSPFQDALVPFAPTDPSAASGAYPWGPPTAGSLAEDQASAGGSSTGYSGPGLSGSSPYVRPRATRPTYRAPRYESYASQQARMPRADLASSAVYPSVGNLSKPYAGYRRPSAVSPYMDLGRLSSTYGDIDNYNQYVRPRLEQLEANRQLGSEIIGLQNSVRNLGRQTRSVRGVVIPQYYMNYGAYYPGFGQ
jgi:hypothetical protein